MDRNIVSVYDYDFDGFDANELAGGYFANLMNAMYNGTAYPLFDKASSGLIDSVIKTKLLDIGRLDENVLRHAGIASEILMTLPTLESASVDELLSLKNENQVPLTNFRKAIYDFSMQIHSLPWDDNFHSSFAEGAGNQRNLNADKCIAELGKTSFSRRGTEEKSWICCCGFNDSNYNLNRPVWRF